MDPFYQENNQYYAGIVLDGKGLLMSRWALGVLVYEMVAGIPPFYHEDRVTMFKNICHVKFTLPSPFSRVGLP